MTRQTATAIEARVSRGFWYRVGGLALLCGGMGAMLVAMAVRNLRSPYGGDATGAVIPIVMALLTAGIPVFLVMSRRRWVRRFDGHGVTLRNGRRFGWADLERVVVVHRRRFINHYELRFRGGGRAFVFYLVLANRDEVLAVVQKLQQGQNPFVADRGG
jgi:hypothetical protein